MNEQEMKYHTDMINKKDDEIYLLNVECEKLQEEIGRLRRGIYNIAARKDEKRLITISLITGGGARCDVEGCGEEADYMGGGRMCCTFHWVKE